jgi:hypothetical protein
MTPTEDLLDATPLEALSVGPRVFHLLVFENSDHTKTEWQDVEIVGVGARFPVVLALTANKREGGIAVGTLGEVAFGQLHSDESERWQAHLAE